MKKRYPHKTNILLVNITRLGDMLQATPTIAGLKMENPGSKVTVLVEKQFEDICHSLPGIDDVVSIDLGMTVRSLAREQDGIIDAYEYVSDMVEDLRSRNFDYCLNMSSSGYTALLLRLLNVGQNGGWSADEEGYRVIESDWAKLFASSVFHQNRQFNSLNLVDVFRCSADVEQHPKKLQIDVKDQEMQFAQQMLGEAGFTNGGPLVALQAGASQEKRQWNPTRFVRLIRILTEEQKCRVVLTGTKKELQIIDQIKAEFDSPNVFVAAGKTNIPQLAALLKSSDVLVTGDTGPMHMSVAVGTPVIAMFLASAFGFETGPYSEGNLVLQPVIGCGPCNPNKPCNGLECHDTIDPDLIAWLVGKRLSTDLQSVPDDIADPRRVIVYRSYFDQFGFLDFRPLNSCRFDTMKRYRDAYRKVWLDDLGGFPQEHAPSSLISKRFDDLAGLEEIIAAAEHGSNLLDQLIGMIKDPTASGKVLGEVNQRLAELDRGIEQIGFHYSHLGPVTRMFVFAKENLVGSDPLDLSSQMQTVYKDLQRRCQKLGRFYQ